MNDYRQAAIDWIKAEHDVYEGPKWDREEDDAKDTKQWEDRITNYTHRAQVLGLDNPLGRQAVAKAAATAVAYLESIFRVYGSIPSPGFSSGEHKGDFVIHEDNVG